MTYAHRMYGTEGSSALVPSYSSLTLLEGGAEKMNSRVARRGHGKEQQPQVTSRLDIVTVIVCTLLVAAGLFGALLASNASFLPFRLKRLWLSPAIPSGGLPLSIRWMVTVRRSLRSG